MNQRESLHITRNGPGTSSKVLAPPRGCRVEIAAVTCGELFCAELLHFRKPRPAVMSEMSSEPLSVGCAARNDPGVMNFPPPTVAGGNWRSPEILPAAGWRWEKITQDCLQLTRVAIGVPFRGESKRVTGGKQRTLTFYLWSRSTLRFTVGSLGDEKMLRAFLNRWDFATRDTKSSGTKDVFGNVPGADGALVAETNGKSGTGCWSITGFVVFRDACLSVFSWNSDICFQVL